MGFLGDLFTGDIGSNYNPQSVFGQGNAQIQNPVQPSQVGAAGSNVNDALSRQIQFLNALQAQGGINNQSQVFNQQQNLANQLQQQALGQGPNPALAQLAQTTGQNVANQAALMASARGASANPALIARQAANQGAGIQQQAAGQAATLGAQQQLEAQRNLMAQQQNMAALSGNQVGQFGGGLQNLLQSGLANREQLMNALTNLNQQRLGAAIGNVDMQKQKSASEGQLLGGLLSGGGAALSLARAHGGIIPDIETGPSSNVGRMLMTKGGKVPGSAEVKGDSLENDTVDAKLSPGEIVIPRSAAKNPETAHAFLDKILKKNRKNYAEGGEVKTPPSPPPKPEEKPWYERLLEPSPEKAQVLKNPEVSYLTNKRGG